MISRIVLTILLVASVIFIVQEGPASVHPLSSGLRPDTRQSSAPTSAAHSSGHRLADSLQTKLDHIQQNGEQDHPDQAPTIMTEEEVDRYIAVGLNHSAAWCQEAQDEAAAGSVTAFLNVDFDEIRGGTKLLQPDAFTL